MARPPGGPERWWPGLFPRLLDMGERPGRVESCPACDSPLCVWCRERRGS